MIPSDHKSQSTTSFSASDHPLFSILPKIFNHMTTDHQPQQPFVKLQPLVEFGRFMSCDFLHSIATSTSSNHPHYPKPSKAILSKLNFNGIDKELKIELLSILLHQAKNKTSPEFQVVDRLNENLFTEFCNLRFFELFEIVTSAHDSSATSRGTYYHLGFPDLLLARFVCVFDGSCGL